MAIAGEGLAIASKVTGVRRSRSLAGARRREIVPNVPIAQQFLLANSPVADMMKVPVTTAAAGSGSPSEGAPGAARGGALAVTLGVISGQMKFTQTTITARSGQVVEITLNNTDDMPHNIVIFKRGIRRLR